MKRIDFLLTNIMLLPGCAATEHELPDVEQTESMMLDVAEDANGQLFTVVYGEKIAVDHDGQLPDNHPQLVAHKFKDIKGRTIIHIDTPDEPDESNEQR